MVADELVLVEHEEKKNNGHEEEDDAMAEIDSGKIGLRVKGAPLL
jgi:hypothetical protein